MMTEEIIDGQLVLSMGDVSVTVRDPSDAEAMKCARMTLADAVCRIIGTPGPSEARMEVIRRFANGRDAK